MFENHRISLIQHCERRKLRFHFVFGNLEACGQTVLPDRAKICGKCQISNIQMRHLEQFSYNMFSFLENVLQNSSMKW